MRFSGEIAKFSIRGLVAVPADQIVVLLSMVKVCPFSVEGQVFIEERSPVQQWTSNCNSYNKYVLTRTH